MTTLPDSTHIGAISLTVSDLAQAKQFYCSGLGFQVHDPQSGSLWLAPHGGAQLVELVELPGARPKPRRTSGLFHFAILLPTRWDLANALRSLVNFDWPIHGGSDHLVSEALYLADPDGNGIELYVDRPREDWPRQGGQIQMDTERLDLESLLGELDLDRRPWPGLPANTRIGHVHLQVASLPQAEAFYRGLLGFEVMQRSYTGALFVAAGGYHHHVGLNTWSSRGAPPPPPDAAGLRYFSVVLPEGSQLSSLVQRLQAANLAVEPRQDGWYLPDPWGNGIRLVALHPDASASPGEEPSAAIPAEPPAPPE